ncbi:MAG TPA: PAS domain S-box protein [Spirochaetota bacterium]|nr:PAS domain S-box protein [Spirochaetota bacterium]HPV42238.1 PAS domain S-box protein [Spirochaetota bacterium]
MTEPKRLLIVEDDAPSALLLSQILKKFGYVVFDPIDSGEKAFQMSCELNPDLILMDITLKGDIDGITAAQKIRDKCGIPFIYTTVSIDDRTIMRARESMPYGYILKPYEKNMIYATVEMALYKYDMERRLREAEERNHAILSSLPDTVFYVTKEGEFLNDVERQAAAHLWTEKVAAKAQTLIASALRERKTAIFDYALVRQGKAVYYEARIIPSSAAQALVIVRDVTSRKMVKDKQASYQKELETQVANRTRELTEANRSMEREVGLRKKMEQSLKIFGHAIEQNPNLVVIIDRDGNVEYVNSAFADLSGYGRNEVVGTNVGKPGNPIVQEPEVWKRMINSKTWKGELYSLKKDGELYYVKASVSPITGEDGETSHFIITAEDITEAKRQKIALDQAKQILDSASQEFMNREIDWKEWKEKMMERNVSRTDKSLFKNIHNSFTQGAGFGTLVTLIDMMTSSAKKSEEGFLVDSQIIELIQNNVNLIKDAFKTFTSIDWIISNDFDLQKISLIELYENVKVVISKVDEYSKFNNNRIIINDFNYRYKDLFVNLNKDYFSKALYEVLINAMKFSKRNSFITVFVNVSGKDAVISVINDPEKSEEGTIGIPVEYEKVVFEPFYRLTKFVHEQYNTLEFGLGLTLVEKIVNKHGGEVFARNIVDHSDSRRESQVKVNVSLSIPLADK